MEYKPKNANLSRANLEGAKLFKANLSGANLSGANLEGADLQATDLSGVNLTGLNLSGANLSGLSTNLSGVNLTGANLKKADLRYANLSGANLEKANLEGADLGRANLEGADLSGADLSNTKGIPKKFEASWIKGVYKSATLTGSDIEKRIHRLETKSKKGDANKIIETGKKENIKAKQQEDYAVELFSNAEKDGDDTSNSNLAKILLSYQNPKCRNYTFIDLFGDILINRKWQDVQHKNAMNKKLVMLNAFDTNLNKDIEIVFEILSNGSYEAFTDPMWGLSPMAQLNTLNLATTLIPVVMKKCF